MSNIGEGRGSAGWIRFSPLTGGGFFSPSVLVPGVWGGPLIGRFAAPSMPGTEMEASFPATAAVVATAEVAPDTTLATLPAPVGAGAAAGGLAGLLADCVLPPVRGESVDATVFIPSISAPPVAAAGDGEPPAMLLLIRLANPPPPWLAPAASPAAAAAPPRPPTVATAPTPAPTPNAVAAMPPSAPPPPNETPEIKPWMRSGIVFAR